MSYPKTSAVSLSIEPVSFDVVYEYDDNGHCISHICIGIDGNNMPCRYGYVKHNFGYDENGFMLYDSMQEKNSENQRKTIIDKECKEGNRYYTYDEFMQLWNDGGYKLFFKNWAIVCSL